MAFSKHNTITFTSSNSIPLPLSSPPPVIIRPCARCQYTHTKCEKNCVFAPYFPPADKEKFVNLQTVFGASIISRRLQNVPEEKRADVVKSLVFEAEAWESDPVFGCAGKCFQLQAEKLDFKRHADNLWDALDRFGIKLTNEDISNMLNN